MEIKKRYRRWLLRVLAFTLIFTFGYTWYYVKKVIPNEIHLTKEQESDFSFHIPFGFSLSSESEEVTLGYTSNIRSDQIDIVFDDPFGIYSEAEGRYQLSLKLFGLFDMKNIDVNVAGERSVIPCGIPVGVYLETDGIMVVGTSKIETQSGETVEPSYGILKSGDYILKVNGERPSGKEQLAGMIRAQGAEPLVFTIRRGSEEMDVRVEAACTGPEDYKAGIWVRDDTHGIGTLTFVDSNGTFGALGHGISDTDTGRVVESSQGKLYEANIFSITKGTLGEPGSLSGSILYQDSKLLGNISKNTGRGVYGTENNHLAQRIAGPALPVAYSQEVHEGDALVRCCVDGKVEDYEIRILKVNSSNKESKSMVLEVTDERLLELTGGIVQGMSGSPIIQDGKVIGAVTHVFIQDPAKGYGIFIENMLRTGDGG